MKQIFLVFFAGILLSPVLHAQNKFFIPYGQSAAEVRQWLETRDYTLTIREHTDLVRLYVEEDANKQVEYAFDAEGRHYATTVAHAYTSPKEALPFRESCLKYMKMISRDQVERNNYGRIQCHTALGKEHILKFFVITHGETHTLQLTAISRNIGPARTKDLTHYEENILIKGLANH